MIQEQTASRLRRRAAAALILIGFLAGAGCSGGDSNSGEAPNTGSKGESKGTRSARAIDPAAQARAESMLLLISDLPDGWRGSPSEDDDEGEEEFRRCIGTDYSDFTIVGEATSDEYSMGENTSVDSKATVFESEPDARGSLEEYASGMRSSTVEDCFGDAVKKGIRSDDLDYKLGEVDVGELSFTSPPNVGEGRAWQVAFPLEPTGEGIRATLYVDVIYLRQGDVLASVSTTDVLSPFDAELRSELVRVVADRMGGPQPPEESEGLP